MGTREMCSKCGQFFIIGQEEEECPHGQIEDEEELTEEQIKQEARAELIAEIEKYKNCEEQDILIF